MNFCSFQPLSESNFDLLVKTMVKFGLMESKWLTNFIPGSEVCRLYLGPEESCRAGNHFNKMFDKPGEIITMWHEVVQSYTEEDGGNEQND
jgi:hypothetical protein